MNIIDKWALGTPRRGPGNKSEVRLKLEFLDPGEKVRFTVEGVRVNDATFRAWVYNIGTANGWKFSVKIDREAQLYCVTRIW